MQVSYRRCVSYTPLTFDLGATHQKRHRLAGFLYLGVPLLTLLVAIGMFVQGSHTSITTRASSVYDAQEGYSIDDLANWQTIEKTAGTLKLQKLDSEKRMVTELVVAKHQKGTAYLGQINTLCTESAKSQSISNFSMNEGTFQGRSGYLCELDAADTSGHVYHLKAYFLEMETDTSQFIQIAATYDVSNDEARVPIDSLESVIRLGF